MKIYNVGPDELCDWDLEQVGEGYDWLVYWYEVGCYDGDGEAVALRKDGMVEIKCLGHCSCYGPMDDWATGISEVSLEELLRDKDSVHDIAVREEIMSKVRELV